MPAGSKHTLITVICCFVFSAFSQPAATSNWTQQSQAVSPEVTIWYAMAYDAGRHQVVLFGGCGPGGGAADAHLAETWVYDGVRWTQKFPENSPPGRFQHAMTYDADRRQVVLFGGVRSREPGYLGNALTDSVDDTWVWDGVNWTQKFPATRPPARATPAMAFDPVHRQVVMTGGLWRVRTTPKGLSTQTPPRLMDTWIWDGTNWRESTATGPARRSSHCMAFDSARGNLVLFGGEDPWASKHSPMSDTWVWNGSGWKESHPTKVPPARSSHGMAYDPMSGVILVFGGTISDSPYSVTGDSWTWDGREWTQIMDSAGPLARNDFFMVTDTDRQAILLYAGQGFCPGGQCHDTWLYAGKKAYKDVKNIKID